MVNSEKPSGVGGAHPGILIKKNAVENSGGMGEGPVQKEGGMGVGPVQKEGGKGIQSDYNAKNL